MPQGVAGDLWNSLSGQLSPFRRSVPHTLLSTVSLDPQPRFLSSGTLLDSAWVPLPALGSGSSFQVDNQGNPRLTSKITIHHCLMPSVSNTHFMCIFACVLFLGCLKWESGSSPHYSVLGGSRRQKGTLEHSLEGVME